MRKSNTSDGILVFDRYYTKKPNIALLILQRVLFCSCISAAAMLFVFSQFAFPVPLTYCAVTAAFSAAVFLLGSTFAGRRYVFPAAALVGAAVIFFTFDDFWLRFSYFVDEAMLSVQGRFIDPTEYLLHDTFELISENAYYIQGMFIGTGIICALYGALCAFSMKRRIHTMPALAAFALLCVPGLLAETFEFNIWFIPAALLFAAAFAIEINYRNGLAVTKNGASLYVSQVREEEKNFISSTQKAPLLKQIGMRASFYSKYTASGVCCLIIFAVALMIGTGVFKEGSSIDYAEIYASLFENQSVDADSQGNTSESPFNSNFSSPQAQTSTLNITNPGSGDRSIIKVSFTGEDNIYLRGDIGIDFDGTGWTTPVEAADSWESSGISDIYRPAELHVLRAILDALDIEDINGTSQSEISIEYLMQTDVVFLPAYTADFSYFNNNAFDVYGDLSVRVSEAAGNYINSVHCKALTHDFSANDGYYKADSTEIVNEILELYADNNINIDDFYGTVVMDMESKPNADKLFTLYSDYVKDTYLGVPDYLDRYLKDYIYEHNIKDRIPYKGDNKAVYAYSAAETISKYLSSNYTYSLSGENQGEYAVIRFLNDSKAGHCSLYASAMTLLLRELDIPARYCTGFSIYPNKLNGSTVELKERNLHAWVEVYIDDLGWVTFDPTSAAVSENVIYSDSQTNPVAPSTSDTTEQTTDIESSENNESKPEYTPPDSGKQDEQTPEAKNEVPVYIFVIIGSVVAVAAVFAALLMKYLSVKNRAEEVLDKAEELEVKRIYDCLIDIFYQFGIKPKAGSLPTDYYANCYKALELDIADDIPVLEKAAFGSQSISEAEKTILCNTFRKTYQNSCSKSSLARRYKIRKIVGLIKTTK